ncbi:MAG: hypothetical protein LBG19_04030 [Prevotellaceae bacterium]|jgi:hypothetical protein|nr:hypothetical protein [Prevotellaceae bacterium]
MEKIGILLARIERVKNLLESWRQKKSVTNIERNIVRNQLAALYDELLDLDITRNTTKDHIEENTIKFQSKEEDISISTTEIKVVEKKDAPDPVIIVQTPPVLVKEEIPVKEEEKEIAPSAKKEEEHTTVRLGDKFVGLRKYLFENFDAQDEMGVARFSAIDDINRAIGINDRFLFIKELFNGDKDLFNKTISTLNSCSGIDDALVYIHENFSWNSETAAVKQLVLLLYRRFK